MVLVTVAMALLLALPLAVPMFSPEVRQTYNDTATTIPFLLLAIWTFRRRLGSAASRERRFWNSMTAAAACWVAQQTLVIATYTQEVTVAVSMAEEILYVGLYLFVVLALDLRPHLRPEPDGSSVLPALRRAATVVFAFGLLTYLVVIPAALDPDGYWAGVPSFTLYLVLDLYLVQRILRARARSRDPRWRHVYGWLLVTCGSWLVLDTVEALMWIEVLPWVSGGTPWDLPWFLPLISLVMTGHARTIASASTSDSPTVGSRRLRRVRSLGSPPILLALLVPALHFAVYGLALFEPSSRRAHELLTFALVVVLGGLAFAYQRTLERHSHQLERERLQALASVEHQAYHDPLTALPNRRLLQDRFDQAVAQAERRDERLALLFFDLDGFKKVNDSSGHAAGDEVLRQVGRRLASWVRACDTLARVGGDEFAVMATDVDSREVAMQLAARIQESLTEPFVVDDAVLTLRASVGIALYPQDGEQLDILLRRADSAMYEAKRRTPEKGDPLPR